MSNKKKVLVVDDEAGIRDSLSLLLKSSFDVGVAQDGEVALGLLDEFRPDLILLDLMMPNLDGLETLRKLKDRGSNIPVIMLTASATVRAAVDAMKCGAVDYLNKPFDVEALTSTIVQTLDLSPKSERIEARERRGRESLQLTADFGPMVGRAATMLDMFEKVRQIAGKDTTVLITGESGTGKELVAKQIHNLSTRAKGPFIAINCAAIPESLIESELFGHEKGAFTHAVEKRLGHFELANGGTLFLDEIGELSLAVQVKMLRFLQEQEFYPVGRSKPVQVDVRIVTATNKNLEELIKEGKFRQDLYYRINVINLKIPPLRDRFEDIPALVEHFVKKFSPVYTGRQLSFEESAMQTLISYDWPGNARELENVIESLMALSPIDQISDDILPKRIKGRNVYDTLRPEGGPGGIVQGLNFEDAERVFESEMILKALRKTNWVQTKAAELLGISRRILKYKMDKLGIPDEKPVEPDSPVHGAT